MSVAVILLLIINVFTFALYGWDKRRAKKRLWRTSENTLLLAALLGGSFGALAGMLFFRHKTAKTAFIIKITFIVIIQLGVVYYFYTTAI